MLFVVWLGLVVLLAAGTLWFQGYLYSEPAEQLYWRAPAAGGAVVLALTLWVVLDYRAPGRYRVWYDATAVERREPYKEIRTINADGEEEVYKAVKNVRGQLEYRSGTKLLSGRPQQVIVFEGEDKVEFKPDRDARGYFKPGDDGVLCYRDDRGRVMREGQFGRLDSFHWGWLLGCWVVNFLFLAVWFVTLWLLLRYQWAHALGLAFAFWGASLIFVLMPLLNYAEGVAR
jgi:hypothetical protein